LERSVIKGRVSVEDAVFEVAWVSQISRVNVEENNATFLDANNWIVKTLRSASVSLKMAD
jgi:aspartyl/asparaginyl beta-hydroxylase (cupin superfamily)